MHVPPSLHLQLSLLTYLICSMSCRRATLTCTASACTHSRQKGQQNTESCGLGRPEVRRPLKHGRQNVCPHGVDTGTRVSPSSSRRQIGHSQAVRSSMLFFIYADTNSTRPLIIGESGLLHSAASSLPAIRVYVGTYHITYATFLVSPAPLAFVKTSNMNAAASIDLIKSLSESVVPITSSPAHDPTLRRLKECCISLHSSCSKWRKLNSDALDQAAVMVNATIKLRSQYVMCCVVQP